ncbi:cytochrome c oxidase subunit 6B, putative [Babesia caballi]|uniref:Cytochrome c oxidase subunit 6B, putative n=1 Tax=Babesia caballi TaxID=5871 RepID=A0AAV4LW64_BABCB|nr:cytochrome c oxidase subunit 6B, putative [Babesia caballi]
MAQRRLDIAFPKDLQFWESYDHYNVDNPHVGDPRNLQHTQWNYCRLRYALFCRCCRELGEENPRCRAEMACTQDFLDIANKYRAQGAHSDEVLPSRQVHNLRQ